MPRHAGRHLQRRACRCLAICRGGSGCPCANCGVTICIAASPQKESHADLEEGFWMIGPENMVAQKGIGSMQRAAAAG